MSRRTEKSRYIRCQRRLWLQPLEDRTTPTLFTVTSTASSGPGSLREAVGFANTLAGDDTIEFAAGLGAIMLSAEILIAQGVTIRGPQTGLQQISGGGQTQIFDTTNAAANTSVSMSNLHLTDANTFGVGGALSVGDENVTLTRCTLNNNTAASGGAIAVFLTGGALTLNQCTIEDNDALSRGGGIFTSNSSVSLNINDSTLSGNVASQEGGGIYFRGTPGVGGFIIRNSTIHGNVAGQDGGGIYAISLNGNLIVQNSTITSNKASGDGGGIVRASGSGEITLVSTIVANNSATAGLSKDLKTSGAVNADHCAITTSVGVTTFNADAVTNGLLGKSFKLALFSPQDNGGPTMTRVPEPDSPLIDQGVNPAPALANDQRGVPFARTSGAAVDIGAVEVQHTFTVTNINDSGDGSLRQAVAAAEVNPGADTILFDAAAFAAPQTIALTTGYIEVTTDLDIVGPGAALATISGSNSSPIFVVNNDTTAAMAFSGLSLTNGSGGNGGAIAVQEGRLTIADCRLTGNQALFHGGAIHADYGSKLNLLRCTISGNASTIGGGVAVTSGGDCTITECSIFGNIAQNIGGGLYFRGGGSFVVRNSTVSSNKSNHDGGGLALAAFNGVVQIQNSTFTLNQAINGSAILRAGISSGVVFIESSILSGNSALGGTEISTPGTVNAAASLLASSAGIGTFNADAITTSLIGKSPLLGPLQDNGGPTLTHLPANISPVIDLGINPAPTVTTDQRGGSYLRQRGAGIDIGAVEAMVAIVANTNDAGAGSLRQALLDVNAAAGTDSIVFDPAVFTSAKTITLLSALPSISDSVVVSSISSPRVTIRRDAAAAAFRIVNCQVPGVGNVFFNNLTFLGGLTPGDGGGIHGGDDVVTLVGCTVAGNSAGDGGGIAIGSNGSLDLLNSTITGNVAERGGGIFFQFHGSLSMNACTVSGNLATATGGGGGLYLSAVNYSLIASSTISGNSANASRGGGIATFGSVNLFVRHCTITDNFAAFTGGGVSLANGSMTINSSLIAGNAAAGGGADLSGAVTANFSLFGIADDGATVFGGNNLLGSKLQPLDPLLTPLQNNGGPTFTHLPRIGSPAREQGTNPLGLIFDQRGLPRVVGAIDIGAAEAPASLIVTNTNDSGTGSLRGAIATANTQAGFDFLVFDAKAFASATTISLTTDQLAITTGLEIVGPSASSTTLSGNNARRIVKVVAGNGQRVAISGLSFVSGNAEDHGGAIYASNTLLSLRNCVISGSKAALSGGAIFVEDGSLIVEDCQIIGNSASATGAGFQVQGSPARLTVRRSTVSGNVAPLNTGASVGTAGGSGNFLLIENSTFSGNTATAATGNGGAVTLLGVFAANAATIRNSTISGNTAGAVGGGIALFNSFGGNLEVQNSTIFGNKANGANGGGGIGRVGGTGVIDLKSTIVFSNSGTNSDVFTTGKVIADHSAFGSKTGITTFTDLGGNLVGVSLKLLPLADNGGPTMTHAPLPGSKVIDAGLNPANLTTDQRGEGFPRMVGLAADIGAFEFNPTPPPIPTTTINGGATQRSNVSNIKVSFSSSVTLPYGFSSAFTLIRTGPATGAGAGPTGPVTLAFTFTGNEMAITFADPNFATFAGSLIDGNYKFTLNANKIFGLGGPLDGNGNGIAGDDQIVTFHRLFGDTDGNATITAADFNAFRLAYGSIGSSVFDFDGDNQVTASDFNQFRLRYGASI